MNNSKKNSMITALMLVLMAGSTGVGADGSDPLVLQTEERTGTETDSPMRRSSRLVLT